MKKYVSLYLMLLLSAFSLSAYAGTGHSHDKDGGHSQHANAEPINEAQAMQKATQTMKNLAEKGVIDKSWSTTQAVKAEKKNFAKGDEWVVSFYNETITDKTKQTLYVFYSLDGHYIAANYTGK